jgi:hypothetical protein
MQWALINTVLVHHGRLLAGELVDDVVRPQLYLDVLAAGGELWPMGNQIIAGAQALATTRRLKKAAGDSDLESLMRAAVSRARMPNVSRFTISTAASLLQLPQALLNIVLADTTGGAFGFYFPKAPVDMDQVTVIDPSVSWPTHNLTAQIFTSPQVFKDPAGTGVTHTSLGLVGQGGAVVNWIYGAAESTWLLVA